MNCGDIHEAGEIAEKMAAKPERSECARCGDPLEGGAKALCFQCQEESTPELENICEREDEGYS